jgi:hypothetical protein
VSTTLAAIRDALTVRLRSLTPTLLSQHLFQPAPTRHDLDDWSFRMGAHSDLLRKFQWRYMGTDDPPNLSPDTTERNDLVRLSIAYPVLPGLYGALELDDLETVMRADARQVRDLISLGDGVAGAQKVGLVRVLAPETGGLVWMQRFDVTLVYIETMTLAA